MVHDGHLINLAAGYTVRIEGHGRLGFRQWGRTLEVPDGYSIRVAGKDVDDDYELCDRSAALRIVSASGDGAWELVPVRLAGSAGRQRGNQLADASEATRRLVAAEVARARADAAADIALDADSDAAIDTLVQLWLRDPEAVRRAARRISRTYDRDLRPQFESLGVEIGRDMAPQLERLTSRAGRDLGPEFARFGAALGASIVSELSSSVENGAGSGDYQSKGKPKAR
jgi:hypothetical protein